jgi:hypothetical protein
MRARLFETEHANVSIHVQNTTFLPDGTIRETLSPINPSNIYTQQTRAIMEPHLSSFLHFHSTTLLAFHSLVVLFSFDFHFNPYSPTLYFNLPVNLFQRHS